MIINVNNKEYNLTNKDLIKIPVEYASAVTGYLIVKTAVDICVQMQANSLTKATLKVGGRVLAATFGIGIGAMAGEMVNILFKMNQKDPNTECHDSPDSVKEDEANG